MSYSRFKISSFIIAGILELLDRLEVGLAGDVISVGTHRVPLPEISCPLIITVKIGNIDRNFLLNPRIKRVYQPRIVNLLARFNELGSQFADFANNVAFLSRCAKMSMIPK